MTKILKNIRTAALAATFTAVAFTGAVIAQPSTSSIKMLTAKFDSRQVAQVEVGDFHFKPGQTAPIHTHTAPAVGYVAKGTIIYQVEGEKPQVLREGDAFFEPVGPRILRFDNASATEEAIFLDFNLEQVGESFIVFEKKLTEKIDRRSLPTIDLGGRSVDQVDIFTSEMKSSGKLDLTSTKPTFGVVAEGVVELRIKGKAVQRIIAGASIALPKAGSQASIVNASSDVSAKVVTFRVN